MDDGNKPTRPDVFDLSDEAGLEPEELAAGDRTGAYEIVSPLARGGFSTVYLAKHVVTDARAAVKVLSRDLAASHEMIERFLREVRAVDMIRHPNIIEVLETGRLDSGRPFYVMEILDGRDLASLLRQGGRLSPGETLAILEQVCTALTAAHAAGIIHRDLKAANIFIVAGHPLRVKLLDFGIAKLIHPEPGMAGLTAAGSQLGTPIAMAPEQIRCGDIDERTDVYALGVLLHHMLTGRYPYEGNAAEVERLHLEGRPPKPSVHAPLPPAIDNVVVRCLQKHPDLRYPSAEAFLAALRSAVPDAPEVRTTMPRVIAVYLQVASDSEEDEALDDVLAVCDAAEAYFTEAGFALPLRASGDILAVMRLPSGPEEIAQRQRVIDLALGLDQRLEHRAGRHQAVRTTIRVHSDEAVVRSDGEIVGGPILKVDGWASTSNKHISATPQAVAGISQISIAVEAA